LSFLKKGRVVARHPEDHSVDLVMYDDGARLAGVQVLAMYASSDTGMTGLPSPGTPPSGNVWSLSEKTSRDVTAIVGFVGRAPVVLGFLFPQVGSMSFADGRQVVKHESGTYTVIQADGSFEVYHPSGSFIRLGSGGHADMTAQDVDKGFKPRIDAAAPSLTLGIGSGGSSVARLAVDPSGNLTGTLAGNVRLTVAGMTTLDCPSTVITGTLVVQGHASFQAGFNAVNGGAGAAGAVIGDIVVTSGDVVADGIGLKTHHHTDPQGGVTGPALA